MTQKVMTNDEAVTGSQKNFFFAIFGTFGRYITNLRGTFVENVNKVENQPTLLYTVAHYYQEGFDVKAPRATFPGRHGDWAFYQPFSATSF
jgi:hypothetical protein